MIEEIWRAIEEEFSGENAKAYINRIWKNSRFNSFDKLRKTAWEIWEIMGKIGLIREIIEYPADGITHYGGWIMPEAWDVEDAYLEIIEPQVDKPLLASYKKCPYSPMMFSAPTPEEGIECEVVYEDSDVRGKIVLTNSMGVDKAIELFKRGAVGIISDYLAVLGKPYGKEDKYYEKAVQLHNYTIPPWKMEGKGFGFSLSPSQGRRLRELMEKGKVRVRAIVRTRNYNGRIPLVSGLLEGESDEEIVITAHLCEPGANDNASGCAVGLEVVRAIKSCIDKGKLKPLQRGIRLLFGFEVRSLQAFINTIPNLRHFIAGINLDMVGADPSDARAVCNLAFNFTPSYTDFLALHLLERLRRDHPLFNHKIQKFVIDDNIMGEPFVGVPFCLLGGWPDAYYHNSLDTPDIISPVYLSAFGKVAGSYCYFLANSGFEEAISLARFVKEKGEEEISRISQRASFEGNVEEAIKQIDLAVERNVQRLQSLKRLVRGRGFVPTAEELERNKGFFAPGSYLFKDEELKRYISELSERLYEFGEEKKREMERDLAYISRMRGGRKTEGEGEVDNEFAINEKGRKIVPLRLFKGVVSFEFLNEKEKERLEKLCGVKAGWGAPDWVQIALFLSNGRRNLVEIYEILLKEGINVKFEALVNLMELLREKGLVRFRPYLTKEDFKRAFAELGLPKGAIVMVHSSLSRFGYVEGGADTVIDALLESIGEEGTLVMPALSFSWLGNPPFEKEKTPSRVGAITEAFRKRKGVLRSSHPTHSICAFGPKAELIVSRHSPDEPVFSKEGAFGKLYELDAFILMLAPLNTNTLMHMAEEWGGVPLPDFLGHIIENGERKVVKIRKAPWHVNFEPHYRILFRRGLIKSTKLGEEEVYLMRARDVVDISLENIRKNPLMVTVEGCECAFCRHIREKISHSL
jgi:aminoglycoside 3-N-acetyltransferase